MASFSKMVNLGHEIGKMSKGLFRYSKLYFITKPLHWIRLSKTAPDSPVIESLAHSYPSRPGPHHNDMEAFRWTGRRAFKGPEDKHQKPGRAQGSNGHHPPLHHLKILSGKIANAIQSRSFILCRFKMSLSISWLYHLSNFTKIIAHCCYQL